LLLSWDGDPNPRQLSGAGLGCFDLRAHRGVALIIRDFSVAAECERADAVGDDVGGCSALIVETRLYDALDPTGQIYSWSSIRRPLTAAKGTSLVVPFSNFLHHSPRGAARFTCAGALTLSVKVSGSKKLRIEMGSAYIDDQYGLQAAPAMVATAVPSVAATAAPTALPSAMPTVMATMAAEVMQTTPSEEASGFALPPSPTVAAQTGEGRSFALDSKSSKNTQSLVAPEDAPDGPVYGSIVAQ
jgi:hypothetical protein